MPSRGPRRRLWLAASLMALTAAAAGQERFAEEVEVRETSVVVVPARPGQPPPAAEVEVVVGGLPQRVTRIESTVEGGRGQWEFVVYLDPRLAGARTRFLATLALAERAEELAALGRLTVRVAERAEPALEATGEWQRIEAGLLQQALAARHRLDRGDRATERPAAAVFRERLDRLLVTLAELGGSGPRVLFLPGDGLEGPFASAVLEEASAVLAGYGWVTVPMPWSERPSEQAAARLDEFERWRQGAEGRDIGAGGRRYVIDFGRVARRLAGGGPSEERGTAELQPELAALQGLAAPTTGRLARRDGELRGALADLTRRWRVWFEHRDPGDGRLRPLEVRLAAKALAAPAWLRSAAPEALAESRLRLALGGWEASGELGFEIAAGAGDAAGRSLTIRGERPAAGLLRLSWAFAPGGEIRHELRPRPAGGWTQTLRLAPAPGGGAVTVLVEDLGAGLWGIRRAPLGAHVGER